VDQARSPPQNLAGAPESVQNAHRMGFQEGVRTAGSLAPRAKRSDQDFAKRQGHAEMHR
jgi:hypothetical protein